MTRTGLLRSCMSKKWLALSTVVIFSLTVFLRLYRLDAPVADWHSWRQSDTAAVGRNFLTFGFDPLHPRFDDLSNIASGKDNPMGYRMVEFPLYQLVAAGLARTFGQFSIEVWLRLVSLVSAAFTAVIIVLLVAAEAHPITGIISGVIYAVLPYSIYYGRTILPETFAVFWAMLSLFLLSFIRHGKRGAWAILLSAAFAGAMALLVKPTAGFLLLPAVYLLYRSFGFSTKGLLGLCTYGIIGSLPFFWWRKWIMQFPEGIPAYTWLLNSNNIRFKGSWFHWLFAKRIGELMLGFWGLIPLGLGLLVKPAKKEGELFRWLLAGSLLYLIIFATGNVQHDYYQILLLPAVSIYVGKGLAFLLENSVFTKANRLLLAAVSCLFMLAFSWYTIRTYYWINRPDIVEAGRLADRSIPKDAKVIARYNGDTTFLYQTGRQGWPLGFDIDEKIAMGATHYVTVSPFDTDTETKQLADCFTVLERNDRYAIFDLTKPTKPCRITNP